MLQEKINQFVGAAFQWEGRTYNVQKALVKEMKAIIFTDHRTFAYYESEFDDFILKVVFLTPSDKPVLSAAGALPERHSTLNIPEVISVSNRADRLSDGLEAIFNQLTQNPSDEVLKKAKAMVDVSNAIVNVEMVRYKCLTLNRQ